MNIILVPKGKGRPMTFGIGYVMTMAVTGLVMLPLILGTTAFQIYRLTNNTEDVHYAIKSLENQQQLIILQHQEVSKARQNAETHLNALAKRLGSMQANILRLNALGERLTRMAQLDDVEFNFNSEPAVGGPAAPAIESTDAVDFITNLQSLEAQIDHHQGTLAALETLLLDRQLENEVTPSGWPVNGGWVSSPFGIRADPVKGYRAHHYGIDIANPYGTPIKAMAAGVVSFAGHKSGYGYVVDINHGNGTVTRYGHAMAVIAKVGDRVQKGQPIALVGSTGRATGPHLHFEVRRNNRPVNPKPYLQQIARR